jgi:hypothetical protein
MKATFESTLRVRDLAWAKVQSPLILLPFSPIKSNPIKSVSWNHTKPNKILKYRRNQVVFH